MRVKPGIDPDWPDEPAGYDTPTLEVAGGKGVPIFTSTAKAAAFRDSAQKLSGYKPVPMNHRMLLGLLSDCMKDGIFYAVLDPGKSAEGKLRSRYALILQIVALLDDE